MFLGLRVWHSLECCKYPQHFLPLLNSLQIDLDEFLQDTITFHVEYLFHHFP